MTDRELRDELVTLLVAGHETTATGAGLGVRAAHAQPARAREAAASLAAGDRTYLDAVVKETLRIRPVIFGVGRVVREEPFELGGYSLPPGIEINPSIAAIHRRARPLSRTPTSSGPSASSTTTRPTPTPGCPSAAARAAAWAPASPPSRWRW